MLRTRTQNLPRSQQQNKIMIKSMTGYGQGIFEGDNCRAVVDIKTVNNRFLDLHARMPSELSSLESAVKKRVQAALKRGRIDLTVTIAQTEETTYEINLPLLKGYLKALREMQRELEVGGDIDIAMISRLPGAMQPAVGQKAVSAETAEGVMAALDQALSALTEMRIAEGRELAAEINKRLSIIEAALPGIEDNATQIVALHRERLQKRLQDLLRNAVQIDENRLAQEAAYLAERSDITEEIARLKSHIMQFRQILDSGEEAGKKLDFLLQEMNREANTILSKSGELEISRHGIEIKSEVEKIREQIQNVE